MVYVFYTFYTVFNIVVTVWFLCHYQCLYQWCHYECFFLNVYSIYIYIYAFANAQERCLNKRGRKNRNTEYRILIDQVKYIICCSYLGFQCAYIRRCHIPKGTYVSCILKKLLRIYWIPCTFHSLSEQFYSAPRSPRCERGFRAGRAPG